MLLLFVIILLVVGLAIIGALYSLFSPFFQQLGDIKQYNMAYYGAVSSVERGMLALRYQGPGYENTSGWKEYDDDLATHASDTLDAANNDFGLLRDGDMYRSIQSRTKQVPRPGDSNVPYALRGENSENYLTLGYNDLMEYTLDIAPSDTHYTHSSSSVSRTGLNMVSLYARLPQRVYSGYGGDASAKLLQSCTLPDPECDWDADGVQNDLVVDRSMEGMSDGNFFRIVPRVDVNYVSGAVREYTDTLIRESHINQTDDDTLTARWGGSYMMNPVLIDNGVSSARPSQNIIGPSTVVDDIGGDTFQSILSKGNVTDLKLLLGLARRLEIEDGKLYPFLETRIETDASIADLYYRLDGRGRVGSYDVVVRVKKPTSDRSLFGSFTIVF